ncbi:MAG: peroxide stress protein YaaA [Saprospiraceae bacterium]
MIVLLSPAKTLDESHAEYDFHSVPRMLAQSEELVANLKTKGSEDIQKLMKVSAKIADLNVARFNEFSTPFSEENAKPSILMFKGDVYTGFDASTLDKKGLEFAQKHIRILSGLYGVLRPMDLMQSYRLEMGTRLENKKGKNLYEFWGKEITEKINEDLIDSEGETIINLASKEYFSSVKPKELKGELIHLNFKEERDGKFKIISFNAKKARGVMARYIVDHEITKPEALKAFNLDNYIFNDELSSEKEWIFTR